MRIESLFVEGFGRLEGRRLALGPGLNILFGPNEAGKSTLQNFIVGMLYGQKRRGARREASPELNRYRPWSGLPYRGVLTYRLANGRTIRIDRSFEPDRTQVWDAETGQELTGTFTMDRRKEILFAEAHLGLTEEAFRSTAWVGQGAVGHLVGGAELVARIANLQESGSEELSVRAAQEWLAGQARAIGSDRAPTRPLAKATKQLQELSDQLSRAERVMEEVRGWEAEATEIAAILGGLTEEEAELEGALAVARLARLEALQSQVEARESTLAREASYAAFPTELSTEIEPLGNELRWAQTEATERQSAATKAAQEVERLAGELGSLRHMTEEQVQRLASLPALLAERDRLRRELADRRSRMPVVAEQPKAGRSQQIPFFVGGGALLLLAAVLGAKQPLLAIALGVGGLVLLWLGQQRRSTGPASTGAEADRLEREGYQAQLATLDGQIDGLVGDLGPAFLGGPDPAGAVHGLLGRQRAWVVAEAERQEAATKALAARERLSAVRSELDGILASAGVSDLEAFQAGVAGAKAYQEAGRALAALGSVLEGRTAADLAEEVALLQAQVRGLGRIINHELASRPPEGLETALRQLRQKRADRLGRQERLRGQIETATAAIPETAELARQLGALHEQKEAMEAELTAIGLAQQVLGDVAEELHREFAPRLGRAMGSLVERLTGGRYNQARIDESLDVRTIGPAERIVDLGALSAGTIDQFYLGLRVALLDMVASEGEPIPLLLDDPFVSYDDERLVLALTLLGEWAEDRQVLLLTCQERDLAAATSLGLPATVIRLDQSNQEVDLSL